MEGNKITQNPNKNPNSQDNQIINPIEYIKQLQHNPLNIRNICVLAHVDHGKTSLVDSLISYNNIINPRLAGDIRYMDSRPDEQERCITMKSSCISITYESEAFNNEYLINLIDSPGHVDFSSEIFSALKICDCAIIVIDVVEGVCSQTESVIKQAWDEKIKCVLVLNKIDRLITEVQMESLEAYIHLNQILEKVNSLMGSLIMRDIHITNEMKNSQRKNSTNEQNEIDIDSLIEEKENELYFSPDKGNVIFASAIDNWGFNLDTFSQILSKKIGFKKEAVQKLLWGDFYFNQKKKKVFTDPTLANTTKPMFVEFVLDNIYKLYNIILVEKNVEKIAKAAASINVSITNKELLNVEKSSRNILKNIFRQWLPIPSTIFDTIIKHLPNPILGCLNKIDILFPPYKINYNDYPILKEFKDGLQNIIHKSSKNNESISDGLQVITNKSDDDKITISEIKTLPNIAFISKMVPLPRKNIAGEIFTEKDINSKDDIKFMAFARNYSGSFQKGQEYYVIGPKHDPKGNIYDIQKFKFDKLYFFMGQYLEEVNEVPIGNIFSIGGLENYIYKTATISSVFDCPSIIPSNINKNSIIKVSIATEDLRDMNKLIDGLKKLFKSDPAVDYYVQSNGEHILVTAGEVHLERCIRDLEDQLARVKVKTSTPIVNFKEGLANKNYNPRKKENLKKDEEKIDKSENTQRKKELNKLYVLDEGDVNIDIDDQKEILKSCTPMILSREVKTKKPEEKVTKHKVKDIKSIKETKTNFYIEKNITKNIEGKGFAEDVTPNKLCKISVISVGMTDEVIQILEKNEFLLKEIEMRDYIVTKDLLIELNTFKEELLNKIENKRLKSLIENNLICFGLGQNMLVIKNISKRFAFFNRIRLEGEEEKYVDEEGNDNLLTDNKNNIKKEVNNDDEINEVKSTSNKSQPISKTSLKKNNKLSADTTSLLEEEISSNLKNQMTPKEFINAVKTGFELAIQSGPLCEEDMYGVIFIMEEIKFNKNLEKLEKSENLDKSELISEPLNPTTITSNTTEDKNQSDTHSLDSNKLNVYGPFLGQIIGTVKDCCRKSFLNGEPRLYEAIYLCLFQIKQEHVGKIHSVVSKRRGKIIDELPNDDATICTIEAVVPVVESFGFVEEIRKNTSGMANPMLQFHKWEMIDVDPFYMPIDKETLENFGTNIDSPNLAKNYVNKIRLRKGLIIDEKIIKGADKQLNLSKKR